ARDITDRKRVEARMHALNEDMEARISEQATQLEASRRELESLLRWLSNELPGSFQRVLKYAEILQSEAAARLNESGRQVLQTICESARQMARSLDAIKDLSRITVDEMRPGPVRLGRLVEDARRELQHELERRQVRWQIGDLPEVHGDKRM